jgi:hypothetical protein
MAKKQMVEDSEIENVGIMHGFMDDIEDLMDEIAEAEAGGDGDQDMAKVMGRKVDSPEILMNNLRGDYRSVDARREELADLVGFSAAAETPDDVLALLQPVLAQQGVGGLPVMEEATMSETVMPMPMPAPAPVPPQAQQGAAGIGALPMGMANGGIVQNFQDGSGEEGVTPIDTAYAAYPQDIVNAAKLATANLLRQQPVAVPDLMSRTTELTPQYAELLNMGDRDAARAQMLFDIGQAAFGFAGNVGPQGEALRGSPMARLAQATSALPAKIGASAANLRKGEQAARLAALQGAQAEQATVRAANVALAEQQQDLLADIAKTKSFRSLTREEKEARGLDVDRPWQVDADGKLYAPGSAGDSITINSGQTYADAIAEFVAKDDQKVASDAEKAVSNIVKIDQTLEQIARADINTGVGAMFFTTLDRFKGQFLNDPDAANRATQDQYLDALLGSEVFAQIGALGIGARGLDTPAEREFLREVLTGTRSLNKDTLIRMTEQRRQREVLAIQLYNDRVGRGDLDQYFEFSKREKRPFEIPDAPEITMPELPKDLPDLDLNLDGGALKELNKRRQAERGVA